MKLPDFLEYEPFNQLREKMGAEHLGDFVFFDPKKNLTGLERLDLFNQGLPVKQDALFEGHDFTLVYKDSRVIAYQGSPIEASDWLFHLAQCSHILTLREANQLHQLTVKTAPPTSSNGQYKVCTQCLQKLRYQDYDNVRQRHKEYSQRVESNFSLEEYFKQYPIYPIEIQDDIPIF